MKKVTSLDYNLSTIIFKGSEFMKNKFKKNLTLILSGLMIYSLMLVVSPIKYSTTMNLNTTSPSIMQPCNEDPPAL